MKNRLFLSLAVLALVFLFSKNTWAQCGNTAVEVLAANRVKAGILNSGDLFHNRMGSSNQNSNFSNIFTVPYTPGEKELSSIYSGGLWLGGLDQDSNLMTACQYRGGFNLNNPKFDFWSGPIEDATGEALENGCDNFDHVWKVTRADILQIIEDYADNGNIDFGVPENIKKWPARGNSFFENEMGFPLPDQDLAPFFDQNENGLFEPLNGEYPVVENEMPNVIPDEITWCVFNDMQNEHTETGGQPLGVEVHLTAYAFNCADDELLNHTIFTKYKIIKKAGADLTEFRAGIFTFGELGCFVDDYFGCDTILNTLYFYNGWIDDEPTSWCDPEASYGLNPPVQAVSFLNEKLGHLVRFHGTGQCDPPPHETPPQGDVSFYNYLSGKWRDGRPLTYGVDG